METTAPLFQHLRAIRSWLVPEPFHPVADIPATGLRRLSLRRLGQTRLGLMFGVDLRSLALLRIALAFLVLMDLVARIPDLRMHYADAGVLPRDLVVEDLNPYRWSLYLANGSLTFQILLFAVTAVAALAMLAGYRTRTMTVVVWALLMSLQSRNPLVLSGADTLLRVCMFWAMLLPLGAVWSIDSRFRTPLARRVPLTTRFLSFASLGLLFQIAIMYWFTAILKSGPSWREDGTALYYALGAKQITRPFGDYLHQFPELLRVLTHASLGLEFVAPALLFLPFWNGQFRTIAVFSIMAFHLGILVTMDVGIFPWTSALCMAACLPTWFYDVAVPRARAALDRPLAMFRRVPDRIGVPVHGLWSGIGGGNRRPALATANGMTGAPGPHAFAFSAGAAATTAIAPGPADTRPDPRSTGTWSLGSLPVTNLFAAFCLVFIVAWNMTSVSGFRLPAEAGPVGYSLGIYQRWNMFAPNPPSGTHWYVIRGTVADGTEIDLLTPIIYDDLSRVQPFSWERPDNIVGDYYRDKYWRKYLVSIAGKGREEERREFAAYSCRTWNGHYTGDARLVTIDFMAVTQRTVPEGGEVREGRKLVSQYTCA